MVFNILQNTPWWVFALFVLLMWLGFQALKPRTLPIWRLLITPAVFIGWGITSLAASPLLILDWSVTALIGAAIAWTTSGHIKIDRARVSLSGSAFPLIRNLLIFSAKYGLAVTAAISHSNVAVWDIAVSGASAGYFLGWLLRFASAYRHQTAHLQP
jgi:hypothetical protein